MFKKEKKQINIQKQDETAIILRSHARQDLPSLYLAYDTDDSGLSSVTASERLEEDGENIITLGKQAGKIERFFQAFTNPFNLVLLLVAIVSFFTDIVIGGTRDFSTIIILMILVCVSSLISFFQSERSNDAAGALSKMISNKVDVYRDGQLKEIDMGAVVRGDIVRLYAGDIIPGDLRFITSKDAFISQAALTGESNPVEKFHNKEQIEGMSLTDIPNLGFMGSNMVSGAATGIILSTGNDTYFGSMAKSLSGERAKNSFERGIDSVSKLLLRFMILMVPLVFIINGVFKNDWANALLFAVSIAVGLTPEMLPVIMTSSLAKGAVEMSKHETIVKNLSAIQTFGEMDILCTDKTGTLTEDKIVLEKYMDVHGTADDKRVLKHAYLNSHFQTGLKNLIDVAIMNRAEKYEMQVLGSIYKLIDEIPFDFARRRMSVVVDDTTGKRQMITKGAVEEIMSACSFVEFHGEILPFSDDLRESALAVYHENNISGLRMIAVAQKNEVEGITHFSVDDEKNMVLLGFIGFLDPPKESSKAAISVLRENGVRTVVLTGDSEGVAVKVCQKVGIKTEPRLQSIDVEMMDDNELDEAVKTCDLFSKLSPSEKERVVKAFQRGGHTVGYMGDGINDAQSLRQADVGISVDNAVDIAKESADIILLKKDLMVLEEGVVEGRKTFINIIKYIKMTASGNLGNMISVLIASIFLPFIPLLPIQILTQNLLNDFAQIGIPFDNVDDEYLKEPRKWETKSISRFMLVMGPVSSIFDILCFLVLYYIYSANVPAMSPLFHAGWFLFGTLSQTLIVHMIRTAKIPFIQSHPSKALIISTAVISVIAITICFSPLAALLNMSILPLSFIFWIIVLLLGYAVATQLIKIVYIKLFKEWL